MKFPLRHWLVIIGILSFILLFGYLSLARHDNLQTQLNDLGNMTQPIYNTTQGLFMKVSTHIGSEKAEFSRLGIHANLILLFFVPIYLIFPDPKILLFTQVVFVALGALPLYWLGRAKFSPKNQNLSLIAPFLYLISPLVHVVTLFDFHPIALAMPLIIFAFYFLETKQNFLFYLFSFLILITKEDMALIVAALALFLAIFKKRYREGFLLFLISITYFFLMVEWVMPFFSQHDQALLFSQRYAYLGENIFEIGKNVITKPKLILTSLINPPKINYLLILLTPFLFLPLISLEVLWLAAPSLAINMLSQNQIMHLPLTYYHSAPILAFIFIALVLAISRLTKIYKSKVKFNLTIGMLLVIGMVFSYSNSPAPYSLISSPEEYKASPHAKNFNKIIPLIPKNASLTVQNNLGAHFAHRSQIFTFPFGINKADYILIDANSPYPNFPPYLTGKNFVFATQMLPQDYFQSVKEIFENPEFGIIYYSDDGYLLFKRGAEKDLNQEALSIFTQNFEKINTDIGEYYQDYSK